MTAKEEADEVKTDAELAEGYDPSAEPDPPVYDERGNVRPRGTAGARPMAYAERAAIAERIAAGEDIDPEPQAKSKRARAPRKS